MKARPDREEDGPATKRDIDRLIGSIGQVRSDGKIDIARMQDRLVGQLRETQNAIVQVIEAQTRARSWERPLQIRMRTLDDVQSRLSLLEERVGSIERGQIGQ